MEVLTLQTLKLHTLLEVLRLKDPKGLPALSKNQKSELGHLTSLQAAL